MYQSNDNNREVVVTIPVYREFMTKSERQCFKRNIEVLAAHPIVLVAPKGLDISQYAQHGNFKTEYFDDHFFKGISGYNRLMLSIEFYERFKTYRYILICQLDAFVFSDQLLDWCSKNYDYIGAPWLSKAFKVFTYITVKASISKAFKILFTRNIMNAVGNGGFSLRKTKVFLTCFSENMGSITQWPANEDYFWSFFAKVNGKPFIKPTVDEASHFCIELNASKILKKNNNRLPFAIHAWERYNTSIWEPHLNKLGYSFTKH